MPDPNHDYMFQDRHQNIIRKERWRLYFNKREAAPLVCSLDNGNIESEIAVRQACLHNVAEVYTTWHPRPLDPSRAVPQPQPEFCVEFDAILKLEFGVAHFYPVEMRGQLEQSQ